MSEAIIYTDGAARGNPGPAGAGAILTDSDGKKIGEVCEYLGEKTNNQAEYQALILALKEAKKIGITMVSIFSDSELMVKQLKGEYKVKNQGLKPLFQEAFGLLRYFGTHKIGHVPREQNKRADQLANLAIDGQGL